MALDQPFPRGTFKVGLGPGKHDVSVVFKPTQSTIVFTRTRLGELAPEYRVQHLRGGQFGRFNEAAVSEPRESWPCRLQKKSQDL
jgi:hypothetical protein